MNQFNIFDKTHLLNYIKENVIRKGEQKSNDQLILFEKENFVQYETLSS